MASDVPQLTPPQHPIDRLWRLMTSNRLLALVLALIGGTAFLGVVLPQVPGDLSRQPAGSRWLAEAGSRFGGLGGIMQEAGLFSLWQSPWLRLLLGLLAFILLLRLAQAMTRWRPADPVMLAGDAQQWPLQASFLLSAPLDESLSELTRDLRQEGWQVVTAHSAPEAFIAAERNRWGRLAEPALYVGALLALAGLWVGQVFGWQETGVVLVPGQPTPLQHGKGAALTLLDDDASGPVVTLQRAGASVASQPFSANGVVRLPGMTVRRMDAGQMLAVSGFDAVGNPLQLRLLDQQTPSQTIVYLVFDQPRAERAFLAPDRQLAFSIVAFPALPERGFSGPTFLVQALQVGQSAPVFNEFVEGDASLLLGADRFELRSGEYAAVRVTHAPWQPLVVLGGLCVLAGMILALARPPGLLHLRLQPQPRTAVQVSARLQPALTWRQADRWLMAWAATYNQEVGPLR